MTIIANPIYDVVFKFLMEDERVARILLSALLQKEVLSVEMRRHEYTDMGQSRISLLRIDFAANVRNHDGSENLILIELQKTWLTTETLRFRQYLGAQYLDKNNIPAQDNPKGYSLPMISIYILGHKLGDLEEPVVYVRRQYLDYDSKLITKGVPDDFIESLTHDTIIVQLPYLHGRTRNHLERLLNVFNQDNKVKGDEHFLQFDEEKLKTNDEQLVLYRLVKAAAAPDIRRAMDVEDEILSEIETRDTTIMLKDQIIKHKDETIQQKDETIQQKEQTIQQKEQTIQQKEQTIQQKDVTIQQKDVTIQQKEQTIQQKNQVIYSVIPILTRQGFSSAEIAAQLQLTEQEVNTVLNAQ